MNIDENKLKNNSKALNKLDQDDKDKFMKSPRKSIKAVNTARKLLHKLCKSCRFKIMNNILRKSKNKFDTEWLCDKCKDKYNEAIK